MAEGPSTSLRASRRLPALVIFDMAGTTVEDRGQVPMTFKETLARHGVMVTHEQITGIRCASKREAIRSLLPPAHADRAERVYGEFRDALAQRYLREGVRSIPGADEAFATLRKAGVKVALSTGFDRDIADLLLSALGWTRNTVDIVVCGDDVSNGRPAPDMILLAMKRAGIDDASLVANLGDTALDLESAARAGVKWNIGVLSGAHAREALERAPHTHIIQSIAALPWLIEPPAN